MFLHCPISLPISSSLKWKLCLFIFISSNYFSLHHNNTTSSSNQKHGSSNSQHIKDMKLRSWHFKSQHSIRSRNLGSQVFRLLCQTSTEISSCWYTADCIMLQQSLLTQTISDKSKRRLVFFLFSSLFLVELSTQHICRVLYPRFKYCPSLEKSPSV